MNHPRDTESGSSTPVAEVHVARETQWPSPEIAIQIGGAIAAAGAVLAYLGWLSARAHAAAFGIDVGILGLQERDYAQDAIGWLVKPTVLLTATFLLTVVMDNYIRNGLTKRPTWVSRHASSFARILSATVGVVAVLLLLYDPLLAPGLIPALFVIALALWIYSGRLRRLVYYKSRLPFGVTLLVTGLMTLLVIWMLSEYAVGVGYERADRSSSTLPNVVLYSPKDLNLESAVVQRLAGRPDESMYLFAYRGLKLLTYVPGERVVLVPEGWQSRRGRVIVLPDDGSFRLEYGQGGR